MNVQITSCTSFLALLALCFSVILAGTAKADEGILHMAIGDPTRKDKEVELRLDGISDTATPRQARSLRLSNWPRD